MKCPAFPPGFSLDLSDEGSRNSSAALGWSSWYAAPSGSQVTAAFVKASATALIKSGLAKKGYTYVNVDEGWLKGRHPGNNTIYEDLEKFPQGMKALGDWVTAQPVAAGSAEKMVYGLYSCRGTVQCGTRQYHAVGSNGHEAADTQWMIDAGARWLKIDSCGGSQNHSIACEFTSPPPPPFLLLLLLVIHGPIKRGMHLKSQTYMVAYRLTEFVHLFNESGA